jgi:formamidopyrimidine-DNA glycosylase
VPELPEVEVLVRHLRPLLVGRTIAEVSIRREKVIRPTQPEQLKAKLKGAEFKNLTRRGKYLVFTLRQAGKPEPFQVLGHLGMTGRMWLASGSEPLPKHAAVVLHLGSRTFVFEDTRYFGRFTLDTSPVQRLGPEPLEAKFTPGTLADALQRSRVPVKVKLLDQAVVAGVGNIYASEALFRAGIAPDIPSRRLKPEQVRSLWRAIRAVLREAIRCGSTVPLNFSADKSDGLFYFGRAAGIADFYEERLRVYDRAGLPCGRCGTAIRRVVHASRATYFCPGCQAGRALPDRPLAGASSTQARLS